MSDYTEAHRLAHTLTEQRDGMDGTKQATGNGPAIAVALRAERPVRLVVDALAPRLCNSAGNDNLSMWNSPERP